MKKRVAKIFAAAALLLVSIISLYPFFTMILMSTYKTEEIFKGIPFLPSDYFMKNVSIVMESGFVRTYINSLIISVSATIGCILISAMAGYALSVYPFKWKKALFSFVMMTMMVPSQIGIIGYMIEMKTLRLAGTLWTMILLWLACGFGAFWMTQFIQGALPIEIVECARIDGCGELKIFFRIALPCMVSGITTLALLIFLWSWNSYLVPLVFVNSPKLYTIPVYIRSLGNAYRTDYAAQITGLLLATIPLILMFILGSKSFIKGLTAGAVKG